MNRNSTHITSGRQTATQTMAPPTIQQLLGGYLIESFVALMLYGVFVAQAYVYALNSAVTDSFILRTSVTTIAALETAHSIFVIHMAYGYAIDAFGNIKAIAGNILWSGGVSLACEMVIVALSQGLYIRRVWIMSKGNKLLTSLISVLLTVRVGFGLGTVVLMYKLKTWSDFRTDRRAYTTVVVGLSLSALVDLLIALTLMFYLWKNKSGVKKSDNIVHALMAYCVNSGLVTTVCSVVTIMTFVFMESSLLFAGFVHIASKLYANSLMGTLNARGVLRQMAGTVNKSRYANSNDMEVRYQPGVSVVSLFVP
ncbi:hypothetical protein BXZ70DRAFT_800516 [Cristinia sonorae]|uniref:DUF6534 domain-containing protein n=1 Tax=Cristinia sonorae TaxID=1940300 RepID=A0A8K0US90_9AGAR|nr:hypothetical protein BXZ70DRAFT_800516 [Cristinia sonorae]